MIPSPDGDFGPEAGYSFDSSGLTFVPLSAPGTIDLSSTGVFGTYLCSFVFFISLLRLAGVFTVPDGVQVIPNLQEADLSNLKMVLMVQQMFLLALELEKGQPCLLFSQ